MLDPARPPLCAFIAPEAIAAVEEALAGHGYGLHELAYHLTASLEGVNGRNLPLPEGGPFQPWRCQQCNIVRLVAPGDQLRDFRAAHGVSRLQVGRAPGHFSASVTLLSLIERGLRPAHPWLVEKYASVCAGARLRERVEALG